MLENLIDEWNYHWVIYEMIHYLLMNYRMDLLDYHDDEDEILENWLNDMIDVVQKNLGFDFLRKKMRYL
jgi:hypothetical protein